MLTMNRLFARGLRDVSLSSSLSIGQRVLPDQFKAQLIPEAYDSCVGRSYFVFFAFQRGLIFWSSLR